MAKRVLTYVGKLAVISGLLLGLSMAPAGRTAMAAEPLSDAQEQAIEQLVRDYIMKHPEVLLESLQAYDNKQRETQEQAAQKAVAGNRDALERDASTPVGGNPKGDVTIVEFFDYRCGYCKKVLPSVQELLKTDGNIRVVFKEFPILGPDSMTASRAALAAWKIAPDKYVALHVALMETRGDLSEARVLETAKKVGIDPEKLKAAMDDPQIKAQIERNAALAQTLQIGGTPAFIIGGKLVPGAVDLTTMREMVKAARAS
ncbi:MAG: DsbA family protein [Rhodospirillales bacterium]|nr:DsbA family protein [Rhodospirillales bacterium]